MRGWGKDAPWGGKHWRLVVSAEKNNSRRGGGVRGKVPGILQNFVTPLFGHRDDAIGRSLESYGSNLISRDLVARILEDRAPC
mmetsp:Transcript_58340/g.121887  ORF Transcript_58340/g.121887 Transcript_58340/m.121887 type:complete len:83 (+) Transcript_58340:63-311(+)